MMLGARNARMAVSMFLADAMPPRLAEYRTTWGYTTTDLPDPRKYFSYEPVAVDKWPSIITVVMGMGRLAVDDYADFSEPEYGVIYQMRTYVWSRGTGPVQATNIRDDLTTVVRDLLIDNPRLQNANHSNGYDCGYRVDDTSVREEYSDLTLLKGERVACASFIAYDLRAQESPTRSALGTVGPDGVSLAVGLLDVPNAPTGVTVVVDDPTGGDTDVTVSWTEPTWDGIEDGLVEYTVQQTSDGGVSWLTLGSVPAAETSYAVTGLPEGSYQWRVAAVTAKGPGPYSLPSSVVAVAAGGVFSPLDLSPALWLDASDETTLSGHPIIWSNPRRLARRCHRGQCSPLCNQMEELLRTSLMDCLAVPGQRLDTAPVRNIACIRALPSFRAGLPMSRSTFCAAFLTRQIRCM
jgi:hypothetical protein